MNSSGQFVVAVPFRTGTDDLARALAAHGFLRLRPLWTRRGVAGVPSEVTRLFPPLGMLAYAGFRSLPPYYAEAFRFALYPLYDQWVLRQLRPNDHIISSCALTNGSFAWIQRHGGKTFLDAGSSHPDTFWQILDEEHRRWKSRYPPVARFYYERSRRTVARTDYVLSQSSFVRNSFLTHGFKPEQVLDIFCAVDLARFKPPDQPRPSQRPLTIINTGMLCLRKGTPYLLEAFRLIRKEVPDARLLLTEAIMDSAKPILAQYRDLPIEWSPNLPHDKLAERLRSADVFVLPSLEDGFARVVAEAMACGLPCITTPNTGISDLIVNAVNGTVVPIRDAAAIRDAVLFWWDRIRAGSRVPTAGLQQKLSPERLDGLFLGHLRRLGLLPTT